MNHVTLAAAVATAIVLVPAGFATLEADIQSDGPAFRPPQQSFTIGDAVITLDLDRGAMLAGSEASVTLVATSDRPHRVAVELRALENMGFSGERVEQPPQLVDETTVTLEARPGGGPPVVQTFRLARGGRHTGRHDWFDIVARAPKGGAGAASAVVGLATWSGNDFAMTIEPPVVKPTGGEFSIAVRVKNTTKKPMRVPWVEVGGAITGVDGLDSALSTNNPDYKITEVEQPSAPGGDEAMLAPGAESLQIFHVKPSRDGITHFTFVAQARTDGLASLATSTMELDLHPSGEGGNADAYATRDVRGAGAGRSAGL